MTFFFINSLTQILTKSFLFLKRKLNIDQLCINTRKGKEKRKGKHTMKSRIQWIFIRGDYVIMHHFLFFIFNF